MRGSRERTALAAAASEWMEGKCAEAGLFVSAGIWGRHAASMRRRLVDLEACGPLLRAIRQLSGHPGRIMRAIREDSRGRGWTVPGAFE